MFRTLLAVSPWLATAAAAEACNTPTVVVERDGTAQYVSPQADNRAELEVVFGNAPTDESILVFDARTGQGTWVSKSDLSLIGIGFNTRDAEVVYSGPPECRPPELPIALPDGAPIGEPAELFPDGDPGTRPIDLFPGETAGGGPRSGLWRAEVGPTAMEGCPPMMQDAFPASQGALPGMDGDQRRMNFADPFHPDTLEMSRTTGVRWQRIGDNRWQTTDMAAAIFAQIPQGEGGGSKLIWTLTVVSPEEMTFARAIDIVLPAAALAIMGGSADGCRVTGTDRWIRIGD